MGECFGLDVPGVWMVEDGKVKTSKEQRPLDFT